MQQKVLLIEEQEEPPGCSHNPGALTFSSQNPSLTFRQRYFPLATEDDWHDWRWQLRNRITSLKKLGKFIDLSDSERQAMAFNDATLPLAITPYYASLISPDDPQQPIRRTMVPTLSELLVSHGEEHDPLGEDSHTPVPGLVHRYPDRVLFLVTDYCSSYCRYCTRSRMVGRRKSHSPARWQKAIAYIAHNPAIRDVLLSGGDPLTMADEQLDWLLGRLRQIPHVEMIRIGTKAPMVLPQRITPELVTMLKKHHPLWMSIHCTHPDELTPEATKACTMLADAGIPLGSQTVLLSGINDSVETMRQLMHGLVKIRVKPYYLYQCDPIIGSAHFRTPVSKGLEMYQGLRGHTSGYAV
ncbi:MAG: KamA family radical SAM protein, partial [Desulfurivibrio sp.]|nr:KamA family radical SAM protein [Desulfurivibrio sp.]